MRQYDAGNEQHNDAWDSQMQDIQSHSQYRQLMQWLEVATKMLLAVDEDEKFLEFLTYVEDWTSAKVSHAQCSSYGCHIEGCSGCTSCMAPVAVAALLASGMTMHALTPRTRPKGQMLLVTCSASPDPVACTLSCPALVFHQLQQQCSPMANASADLTVLTVYAKACLYMLCRCLKLDQAA